MIVKKKQKTMMIYPKEDLLLEDFILKSFRCDGIKGNKVFLSVNLTIKTEKSVYLNQRLRNKK